MSWRQQQINVRCKLYTGILLVFLAFSSCLYSEHYVFAQTDQTASKLQAAKNAVEQAFNAVLDAETAGANVTDLLSQLNNATVLLAQAENANRIGDYSTAAIKADAVLPIAQEVITSAQEAQQAALINAQYAFWYNIAFTVIGVFVFVLVLFLVWRRLKRSYIRSLSDAKPEVSGQ